MEELKQLWEIEVTENLADIYSVKDGKRTSCIVSDIPEETAKHIVELHNKTMERKTPQTQPD